MHSVNSSTDDALTENREGEQQAKFTAPQSYAHSDSVILIFCKAPQPGQVKTRLMPALSAEQAAELHRRLTRMTLERALQNRLCAVQLWCAPDMEHPFFRECAERYPITLHHQQGQDLGERMHNTFSAALQSYSHAILTGCDCPSLSGDNLRNGMAALQNGYDVVIAPAEDGGYVLIGLNRPQPALFQKMPWGSETIFELTCNKVVLQALHLYELPMQWDVDIPSDLERLQKLHREL